MVKEGYKTTEFWMSAIGIMVTAVIAVMVGYGVVTSEQAVLWKNLSLAIIPLVIGVITVGYSASRGKVKSSVSDNT